MTATVLENRPERGSMPALRHGLRQRCPSCGDGQLFSSYLKVNDQCPACGEALHHHRADDLPAYLTVLVVAKMIGIALPLLWGTMGNAPVAFTLMLVTASMVLMLFLLPRIKSMTVAYQWANRMHGF